MSLRPAAVAFAALCVFTAGEVLAQGGSHGSIYTRFVLGDRIDFYSSQASMMGGAGTALPAAGSISLANPALWGQQSMVRLGIGAEVHGLRAEDALGQTAELGAGHLTAIHITVPLIGDVLGSTIALRPFTRVNYLVIDEGELIVPEISNETIDYRVNLEGGGGLQEAQLGVGWTISPTLSIGASARMLFGVLEDRQRTEFLAPNAFPERVVARRTRMWGMGATLGAAVTTGGVLAQRDELKFGAALSLPTTLQGRRVGTMGISLDQDTLRAETRGTTQIPLSATSGFAYAPNARWLIALDARYEPWTSFESDFAFSGYDPVTGESALNDRLRVGGGFQFVPAGADRNARVLARTAYRFGAYFDRGYVSPRDHTVSTLALTGGLSLPALFPGTRFDLGFEVGTRGTTDSDLVRDLFLKGTATINFGERWFVRREFG